MSREALYRSFRYWIPEELVHRRRKSASGMHMKHPRQSSNSFTLSYSLRNLRIAREQDNAKDIPGHKPFHYEIL